MHSHRGISGQNWSAIFLRCSPLEKKSFLDALKRENNICSLRGIEGKKWLRICWSNRRKKLPREARKYAALFFGLISLPVHGLVYESGCHTLESGVHIKAVICIGAPIKF